MLSQNTQVRVLGIYLMIVDREVYRPKYQQGSAGDIQERVLDINL
ncbi:hypothetical protein QR98_0019510, partial [Sarcoptes scabiei]